MTIPLLPDDAHGLRWRSSVKPPGRAKPGSRAAVLDAEAPRRLPWGNRSSREAVMLRILGNPKRSCAGIARRELLLTALAPR